jgi:putative endonuclease
MSAWCYILRLQSSILYTGSTRFLDKRIQEHLTGRGCRTTKIDPPLALAYSEKFRTYKEALRREQQIKGWTHAKKEALINGNLSELKQLSQCRKTLLKNRIEKA